MSESSHSPEPRYYEGPLHGPFAPPVPGSEDDVAHQVAKEAYYDPAMYQLLMQRYSLQNDRIEGKIGDAEYRLLDIGIERKLAKLPPAPGKLPLADRVEGLEQIAQIRHTIRGILPRGRRQE